MDTAKPKTCIDELNELFLVDVKNQDDPRLMPMLTVTMIPMSFADGSAPKKRFSDAITSRFDDRDVKRLK